MYNRIHSEVTLKHLCLWIFRHLLIMNRRHYHLLCMVWTASGYLWLYLTWLIGARAKLIVNNATANVETAKTKQLMKRIEVLEAQNAALRKGEVCQRREHSSSIYSSMWRMIVHMLNQLCNMMLMMIPSLIWQNQLLHSTHISPFSLSLSFSDDLLNAS